MNLVYPKTAGTLCARMSRGLNGQDAAGDLLVVLQILPGGGISGTLDASYYKGTGTRNGKEREFIAVSIGNGQTNNIGMNEQANTLDCMHDAQAVVYPGVGITSKENASNPQPGDPAPTISTDSRNYLAEKNPKRKYIVRRLTPTECARLQGFPDFWTDGAGGSDSAKYKMWGNGIALPCAEDVMGRIADALREEDRQSSEDLI